MLYKAAFVSFAIHCSNRVISKNISNAGVRLLWSLEKVSLAGLLPGEQGWAGRWSLAEVNRAGQSCQGASRGTALTHCVLWQLLREAFDVSACPQIGEPQNYPQVPPQTARDWSRAAAAAECTPWMNKKSLPNSFRCMTSSSVCVSLCAKSLFIKDCIPWLN